MIYFSDCHTDFMTEMKEKEEREKYVKFIKASGGDLISCAIFTTFEKQDFSQLIEFKKEIEEYKNKYNINLFLTLEDIAIFNENNLSKLISLSPLSVTLTWNYANQFAGGALSKSGLTKLGIKVIKLFEEKNILIDCAHLNRKSFYQFCNITKFPIFVSHSNVYSLHKKERNMTDKQIEKIVLSGGFLGLTFYQDFISNKKISSKDIANQFDYLIKNFGSDNFGLGTDFFGFDKNKYPADILSYKDLFNLQIALFEKGYKKEIVDKLFFDNYKKFLENFFDMTIKI